MSNDPELKELLVDSQCYSSDAIRAFLRYSRRRSDDNLHNALPRTGSCAEHVANELFPEWYKRDTLLSFCESMAQKRLKDIKLDKNPDDAKSQTLVDPRIDAYGARDSIKSADPSKEDNVLQWVQTERNIEGIIRETSIHLLADKCGSFSTSPQYYMDSYRAGSFKK